MKKKQAGFGIVGVLVAILIIGGTGFVGWFVWQKAKLVAPPFTTPPKFVNIRDQDAMKTAQAMHDIYLKAAMKAGPLAGVNEVKVYLSDDLYKYLLDFYSKPQPTNHLNDIVACNFGQSYNDLPLRTFVQKSNPDTTVVKIVVPKRDNQNNLSYNVPGFFYTVDIASDRITNIVCD